MLERYSPIAFLHEQIIKVGDAPSRILPLSARHSERPEILWRSSKHSVRLTVNSLGFKYLTKTSDSRVCIRMSYGSSPEKRLEITANSQLTVTCRNRNKWDQHTKPSDS